MMQHVIQEKLILCHLAVACCLIEKDTEADAYGAEYQFHCLIIEDTVANVRRNE